MKFINLTMLPFILIFFIAWIIFILKNNKNFFKWVEDHWFLTRTKANRLSTIFYIIGLLLLLVTLLDLRGREEKITAKSVDKKTIILIDSSASMLVEDVRPNRFQKAIFLAKHYVKKATGQKIAVMVFSDRNTKLVPFTDDLNLVEARLDRLTDLKLNTGGTGLTLAISESIQYLRGGEGEFEGNIIVFTDAEEHEADLKFEIPASINVGVVGIGTANGGPIPIRNKGGVFRGNKKYQGKVIISKLNDKNLKKLGENIKSYQYWVASSYSLPTYEILNFFSSAGKVNDENKDLTIRPVLYYYLAIPAVIFLILSFIIGRRKVFYIATFILIIFPVFSQPNINSPHVIQGMNNEKTEEEEPIKSEYTLALENALASGELSEDGKLALANSLMKDGFPDDSAKLYGEILPEEVTKENLLHKFNQATAELQTNDKAKAIDHYNKILDKIEGSQNTQIKEIEKKAKLNILKALQNNGQGKGKSQENDEDQEDQDQEGEGSGDGSNKDKKKDDSKDGEKKEENNKEDGKNDKNKEQNNQEDNGEDQKKKSNEESKGESEEQKDERKKKLPALLKQLLSDDNKLQKKLIDANTTDRKMREKKDW